MEDRFTGRKKPVESAKPEWWVDLKKWVYWALEHCELGETDYEAALAVNNLFSLVGTREAEIEKLKQRCEMLDDLANFQLNRANTRDSVVMNQDAKLTLAEAALEHYESAHYDHSGNPCRHDNTATETLAAIKEGRGE